MKKFALVQSAGCVYRMLVPGGTIQKTMSNRHDINIDRPFYNCVEYMALIRISCNIVIWLDNPNLIAKGRFWALTRMISE